jgi:hypothetical protein
MFIYPGLLSGQENSSVASAAQRLNTSENYYNNKM